jgi:hypothetical protein
MRSVTELNNTSTWLVRAVRRGINYKMLSLGLLGLALTSFADVSLLVIGHGLHWLYAIVETVLGYLLVEGLDLTHRQAQAVVAYGSLGAGLFALVQALRWVCRMAASMASSHSRVRQGDGACAFGQ